MSLFERYLFILYDRLVGTKQQQILKRLVELEGGTIMTSSNWSPNLNSSDHSFFLVKDKSVYDTSTKNIIKESKGLPVLPICWLSDCIDQKRIIDVKSYLFNPSSTPSTSKDPISISSYSSSSSNSSLSTVGISETCDSRTTPKSKATTRKRRKLDETTLYLEPWACMRKSVLSHPNPELEWTFQYLADLRNAHNEKFRSQAYEKAISVIRAVPVRVKSPSQLEKLLGPSVLAKVEQVYGKGNVWIREGLDMDEFQTKVLEPLFPPDEMEKAVISMTRVYGIGPSKAKTLYQKYNIKSLDHLRLQTTTSAALRKVLGQDSLVVLQNYDKVLEKLSLEQCYSVLDCVKRAIESEIGRQGGSNNSTNNANNTNNTDNSTNNANNTNNTDKSVVSHDKNHPESWIALMPVGGYRRGKSKSHDLDILLVTGIKDKKQFLDSQAIQDYPKDRQPPLLISTTHTIQGKVTKDPLAFLDKACSTLIFHKLAGKVHHHHHHGHGNGNGHGNGVSDPFLKQFPWIGESFLVLLSMPDTRLARVDFIACHYQCPTFPYMLLGWTGSQGFNQSIRLLANQKFNVSLSNYGVASSDNVTQTVPATSEREIFEYFGLEYLKPEYRNA